MEIFIISLLIAINLLSQAYSCPSSRGEITSDNLASYSTCTTLDELSISSNDISTDVVLNTLSTIHGDLHIMNNFALPRVSLSNLKSVGGNIHVGNNTSLEKLELPSLTSAVSVTIIVNPDLRSLDFTAGLSSTSKIVLNNNGRLSSVAGLKVSELEVLDVDGNPSLDEVTLPNLSHLNSLKLGFNKPSLSASFPLLATISGDMIFTTLSTASFPSLQHIIGKMSVSETNLRNYSLPSLFEVHNDLAVRSNKQLESVEFPKLRKVGGTIFMGNDTELKSVALPSLTEVDGSLVMEGRNLGNLSLPSIQTIAGALKVVAPVGCSRLSELKDGVVNGNFTCSGFSNSGNGTSGLRDDPFGNSSGSANNGTGDDSVNGHEYGSNSGAFAVAEISYIILSLVFVQSLLRNVLG